MGNPAGVRRDFEALEERRMEAARLLKQGVSQSEVARRLGVDRQSAVRWDRQLAQSGREGLKKAGRAGRKRLLSGAQPKQLERAFKRGPEALGYAGGLWTTNRVRGLIAEQCGVRYHEAHVWRILRRLGGVASAPPEERWSVTSKRPGSGRKLSGRGFKKSFRREAHDRLHRRERVERAAATAEHFAPTARNS